MIVALIDVGSNTIRLSVYELNGRDRSVGFRQLFSKKVMAGLANYVDDVNNLTAEGILRACDAINYLLECARIVTVDEMHIFATASLRNVDNSSEAIQMIEQCIGSEIELISNSEEALLGYRSAQHDCHLEKGAMADIGGGSTEIVCFTDGEPQVAFSMPIGSLKLFKTEVGEILPTKAEQDRIRERVKGSLNEVSLPKGLKFETLCGVGGSARAVKKMLIHANKLPQGTKDFEFKQLDELVAEVRDDPRYARDLILKCCPDRAHTLVPGMIVLHVIAKRLKAGRVHVCDYGVREGYLLSKVLPRLG